MKKQQKVERQYKARDRCSLCGFIHDFHSQIKNKKFDCLTFYPAHENERDYLSKIDEALEKALKNHVCPVCCGIDGWRETWVKE